jgi:hypothetical protein
MTAPLVTSRVSTGAHRHRMRNTAAAAGVAAVIAVGGFAATNTFGPDAYDPPVAPSDSTMRDLQLSVAGQYGSARSEAVRAGERVLQELQRSVAGQYGSARSEAVSAGERVLRELQRSVSGQYGVGR